MAITATAEVKLTIADPATGLNEAPIGTKGLSTIAATGLIEAVLPANTAAQSLPFPTGVTTAKFAFVRAIGPTDLTVQVSTAAGASVLSIPQGAALIFYDITALYVNTVAGGLIQYAIAG